MHDGFLSKSFTGFSSLHSLSVGLPMSFFNNKEVLQTVCMTTECGDNYIRTKPGGVEEPRTPHYHTVRISLPNLSRNSTSIIMGEHNWSMEGWIHSKMRNRLGQDIVECLVSIHTNLHLDHRLEIYKSGILPWDIEMTVEEPSLDEMSVFRELSLPNLTVTS